MFFSINRLMLISEDVVSFAHVQTCAYWIMLLGTDTALTVLPDRMTTVHFRDKKVKDRSRVKERYISTKADKSNCK